MPLLTHTPLDINEAVHQVADESAGAWTIFVGAVRNNNQNREVRYLDYECYSAMAEEEMDRIIKEACKKWPVCRWYLCHRLGKIPVGEPSIIVAVATGHRDAAFTACRYIIDEVKNRVPIWKKEYFTDGAEWLANNP